ncbi:MAG TPA: hypothetical protein VE078_08340 [Thermoanaerobaculia bacterium]|nr:hypothetical protein [Thermoanaerobaculia bacterium]
MIYYNAISQLARRFRRNRRGAWIRAAEGLLLFALPYRKHRFLSNRLLSVRPFDPSAVEIPPNSMAGEMRLEGSTENAFFLDLLEFSGDANWVPAFWLGIDEGLLWSTIVGQTWVWAIYNPAFFFAKLRASGFEVAQQNPGRYTLRYCDGSVRMKTDDLARPIASIRRRLLREESVVQILLSSVRPITTGESGPFAELRICLLQYSGAMPAENDE